MTLGTLDIAIILLLLVVTLLIGIWSSKKAGKSSAEFFLSGRNMPWWLLGISMVATTFSADTPNLVTDIIRKNGVSGNWVWWAFLLTGMTTVFVYAKLWRRSGITTDLEFYELRYSGKPASFLRAFRAVYLGLFFNVIIMASVLLAGIKIAGVMLNLSPLQTVLLVSLVTVVYSLFGGLRGVILTDFVQFGIGMLGTIAAAIYIINMPEISGLNNLINHPNVIDKIPLFPDFTNLEVAVPLFFIPIAVQWWSVWYPGAEPGGGGYIAQRMLSARNESGAVKATLLFNFMHYAVRPWPWILIALASLVVFPDLETLQSVFPHVNQRIINDDLAFPAMLTMLPQGLLGLVIAALIAALMSTISTHLNWGSSYLVHDFYKRFLNKEADDKEQVLIGRISTVVLMVLAAIMSLFMSSALDAFNILLQIGAGTGLLFILRWFWWRINAYSEITAMAISFVVAFYFELIYKGDLLDYQTMMIGIAITTISWLIITLVTRPTSMKTLSSFYALIRPHEAGWKPVTHHMKVESIEISDTPNSSLAIEILMLFVSCILIYSCLFGMGYWIYGETKLALIALGFVLGSGLILYRLWKNAIK